MLATLIMKGIKMNVCSRCKTPVFDKHTKCTECKPRNPTKPYIVNGWSIDCRKFSWCFEGLVEAVQFFEECVYHMDTVFIHGVSQRVKLKLQNRN